MNRDPRGYYAALHVAPDATAAEIQRAFRALMRLRHPDVEASSGAGNDPGTNEGDDVRRILESFAVLRNPRSRASGGPGRTAPGAREILLRHHRQERPVLRVTPVRWERGPL